MRIGWTKAEVVAYLKTVTPPTPTDDEHQAEWWNTTFGRKIKVQFDQRILEMIDVVINAREEK